MFSPAEPLTGNSSCVFALPVALLCWEVRPRNTTSANPFAIGARVTVGGTTWLRWVEDGSTSQFSSSPAEMHFGLADAPVVDQLEITWRDGFVEVFTDVPVNHVVTVDRGAGVEPVDFD